MATSVYQAFYSVDTDKSELSILRLNVDALRDAERARELMLETAHKLGISQAALNELKDVVATQPTERELSADEIATLDTLLVNEDLERLGILANKYGIHFGMSRDRGDGTVTMDSLENISFGFQSVFSEIKAKSFANLTFNGVVFLKEKETGTEIALVIRDSEIKIQKPTIVWEDIEGLDFPEQTKDDEVKNSGSFAERLGLPKDARGRVNNGPFTKCWG